MTKRIGLFGLCGFMAMTLTASDQKNINTKPARLWVETNKACYQVTHDGKIVATAKGQKEHVSWSPGRKFKVVAQHAYGTVYHLIVTDAQETRKLELTKNHTRWPAHDWPQWSPRGDELAFESSKSGPYQIYVVKLSDFTVERRTDLPHGARSPHYLPDGRMLYISVGPDTGQKVRVCDLILQDGEKKNTLIHQRVIFEAVPAPDGKKVAMSTLDHCGQIELFDLETHTSTLLKPPDNWAEKVLNHAARKIAWSPDGQTIACQMHFLGGRSVGFVGNKEQTPKDYYVDGDWEIFLFNLKGQNHVVEFKEETPLWITWEH